MSSITVTVENNDEAQNLRATLKTIKYMLKFIVKEKGVKLYSFLMIFNSLFGILPTLVYTIFPGLIINELIGKQQISKLMLYVGILIIIPIINSLINRFVNKTMTTIRLKISAVLAKKFDLHTASMDYETLENPDIQDMSSRVMATYTFSLGVIDKFGSFFSSILRLITIFSIIATINFLIVFLIILIIFINSFITKRLDKKQFLSKKELSKHRRLINALLSVLNFSGYAKEIRLFNLKSYFADMLFKKRMEANKIDINNATDNLNAGIFFSITGFIQQLVLYIYVIYMVIYNGLSIGNMSVYMSAINQFTSAFNSVVSSYLSFAKDSLDVQEMMTFMNIPLRQYESGCKSVVWDDKSIIEFKNVSFKYSGSESYALKNLNIIIRAKERLCIVGINGSGKSTFIKLLTRLYFPTEGEILLNGVSIYEYDYNQYERLFAPIFQDCQLFFISLAENIILTSEYNQNRLADICNKCGLNPLINKLPKGYNTRVFKMLDGTGFNPSGGETQRIAIARAIYHGGEIFLLDEPTAALDPLAEHTIYTQFNKMVTDKTAVLITHRLSAVQLADKIAVFDEGQLIEYGTHKELYAKGGIYTEMFDKQAQFYRDEPKNEMKSDI